MQKKKMIRLLRLAPVGLVLLSMSGCLLMDAETTMIQRKYATKRNECREAAEQALVYADSYVDYYGQRLSLSNMSEAAAEAVSSGNRTQALTTMFSDCMNSRGWIVATQRQSAVAKPGQPAKGLQQGITGPDSVALSKGGRGTPSIGSRTGGARAR